MSTDPFATPSNSGDRRQPGEFKRKGKDGAPYVKSLTNTRQPTGLKPELLAKCAERDIFVPPKSTVADLKDLLGTEPAWELYGRPSSFGKLISDDWSLFKWLERNTVLGIAMDPQLLRILDDVAAEGMTENQALDAIAAKAHDPDHADTKLAADRGTFCHVLTEWADAGMTGTPPWCDPRFDLTDKMVDAVAAGWLRLLEDNGLELLASEATVINDEYRLAGTLDRLARLTKPLVFDDITIPAGTVIVLDIKTSKLNPGTDGTPVWWDSYPLQLAAYAGSKMYDPDTDTRSEWPFTIDQYHAVIAHLDIPKLMDGEAVWQLIHVDLGVARRGIDALHAAEGYNAAPKFKMAATPTRMPAAVIDHRAQLMERYGLLNDAGKAAFGLLGITKESTDDEVRDALDSVDPFTQVAPPAPPRVRTAAVIAETTPDAPVMDEHTARRISVAQHVAATVGDDRKLRRLLLHAVNPEATSTDHFTAHECDQLDALCDAFGNTITIIYNENGSPELVGNTAAILASVTPQ